MTKAVDISGQRFGMLTAVSRFGSDSAGKSIWKFVCDCGNIKNILAISVRRGLTTSCGCVKLKAATQNAKKASIANFKHGATGTPEHKAWASMIDRCCNPDHQSYRDYGGRGIYVTGEWIDDFPAFLAHVGNRPSAKFSLDRIDNNDGYRPGNVRWATWKTQANNRRNNKDKEVN